MTGPTKSPLARLMLFMICLGVLGNGVAIVHYYAIDLPQQAITHQPPKNEDCFQTCDTQFDQCISDCHKHGCTGERYFMCERGRDNCVNDCF